jgi:hypothetical protein
MGSLRSRRLRGRTIVSIPWVRIQRNQARKRGREGPISMLGGEGGIRTHGTLARTTVFETVPFDHSGTSPKVVFGAWGAALGSPMREVRDDTKALLAA